MLLKKHGSPLYVYDLAGITERARTLTGLNMPFGLTVRYAVKANPHPRIISLMAGEGISFRCQF